MKKLLMMTAIFAASTLSVQAVTVDCTDTWAVARSAGYTCVSADKIFASFTNGVVGPPGVLAGIPDDWILTIGETVLDEHYVTLTGPSPILATAVTQIFGISYAVAVDPNANKSITSVSIAATMNPGQGAPQTRNLTKWLYDTNGLPLGSGSTDGSAVLINIAPSKVLLVEEVFTLRNSTLSAFTDTYFQTGGQVPEPATYAMMGLGLAGLGLLARRKKA